MTCDSQGDERIVYCNIQSTVFLIFLKRGDMDRLRSRKIMELSQLRLQRHKSVLQAFSKIEINKCSTAPSCAAFRGVVIAHICVSVSPTGVCILGRVACTLSRPGGNLRKNFPI